tara:strand:- start:105 stop:299 length:195 start_codon:yes stop_codon:yes gene_type:complete
MKTTSQIKRRAMRLTEKQVIQLEEEEKLAKRFEEDEEMTLGECEEELRKIEERFGDDRKVENGE